MPLYALGESAPTLPADGRYWIAPDAHIIGQVRVGEDVGVWFGAVLRGDNEPITIGRGTNIQEGVVGHTDIGFPLTVGSGCTIGHRAIIHGCVIGDNVLIGMGATVMNGARIGTDSLVAAGALVLEGREYPSRSLIVGAPAKATRTLDDLAVARLQWSATHYIKAWQRFVAELRPLP